MYTILRDSCLDLYPKALGGERFEGFLGLYCSLFWFRPFFFTAYMVGVDVDTLGSAVSTRGNGEVG